MAPVAHHCQPGETRTALERMKLALQFFQVGGRCGIFSPDIDDFITSFEYLGRFLAENLRDLRIDRYQFRIGLNLRALFLNRWRFI